MDQINTFNYRLHDIVARLSKAEKQVATSVTNKRFIRDLLKMIRNIDSMVTEISRESVECRRLKKETMRYKDLTDSTVLLLDNLEQHIILALLLG
jgi:hypothetical protein